MTEDKFYIVFCPAFAKRISKCETFEQAVGKAKAYAKSQPATKFYIAEVVGGFEHKVIDSEINQIEINN